MKKHYIATILILSFFLTTFTQAYNWKEESAAKKLAIKYFAVVKHYIDKKHKSYKNPSIQYYSDGGIIVKGWGSFEPITINKKGAISYKEAINSSLYNKVFYVNNKPVEIHGFVDEDLMVKFFLDNKKREILTYRYLGSEYFTIKQFQSDESFDIFYCGSVCHDEHHGEVKDISQKTSPYAPITKDIQWVNEFLGVKADESYRDQDAMKLYEQYAPIKDKYLQDIKKEHNNISIKYFIDWHDPKSYFDSAIDADKLGKEVSQKEALNKGIYSKVTFTDDKPIFQEAFNKDKDIMKRYFDAKGRVVFRIDYDDAKEDGFAIFKFRDDNKWMDFVYCYDKQCIVNDYLNADAPEYKRNTEHLPPGEIIYE